MRKNWEITRSTYCSGYKNCHEHLRQFDLDDPNCKDCMEDTKEDHDHMTNWSTKDILKREA